MSKYFAIFIPILAIIINTLFILFRPNNKSSENTKKTLLFVGVLMFILGVIVFIKFI